MFENQKVPAEIRKIIGELAGDYQDEMKPGTLKKWQEHALLLHKNGMSFKQIDDTLNALFWSVANEFGA